jgi:hypothetical protein
MLYVIRWALILQPPQRCHAIGRLQRGKSESEVLPLVGGFSESMMIEGCRLIVETLGRPSTAPYEVQDDRNDRNNQ